MIILTGASGGIGKEMLKNPNIKPRELEAWGFVVIEYNQPTSTDTAA